MKFTVRFLLLFALMALLLSACTPAAQGARSLSGLPTDAKTLILVLITAALTAAVAWVFSKTGLNFGGYVEPLALALSGIVVTLIEAGLQMIPPVFDDIVLAVIHAIVLALGGGLTIILVRRIRAKNMRLLLR